MRHAGRYLSELNQGRFTGLKAQKEQLAMARAPEDLSKKFRYNQRRELRLLEEAGGVVRPISDFSARQIAAMYLDLFQRRWGFAATGAERMADVLERLRELLIGSVLMLDDKPIAIQLVYRVEAPEWISVEYINGGVDPETKAFSPGSVLSFLNTQLPGRTPARATNHFGSRSVVPTANTRTVGATLYRCSRRESQAAVAQAPPAQQAPGPAGRPGRAGLPGRFCLVVAAAVVAAVAMGGPRGMVCRSPVLCAE